jgi:hypothetical protein
MICDMSSQNFLAGVLIGNLQQERQDEPKPLHATIQSKQLELGVVKGPWSPTLLCLKNNTIPAANNDPNALSVMSVLQVRYRKLK